MIPKIVHQTSKSDTIPIIFEKILEKNKDVLSNYEFKHWYDNEGPLCIPIFLEKEYPQLYEIFKKARVGVQRSDIARIAILHFYGGVYADMDILFLKKIDEIIDNTSDFLYFALEPKEQSKAVFQKENMICNAFIVSPPKHPIISKCIDVILQIYEEQGDGIFKSFNIFGTDILSKAIMSLDNSASLCKVIRRELIYPINDLKLDSLECCKLNVKMMRENRYGDSYMVHYWIHSNFESSKLLESFKYKYDKDINTNVYMFFKELYQNNKHLKE